ncbi:MAG: Yip1 family protein [Alphaproteobacteria bacterium]|nr:Yip1 family protein [Alphaproteobacteria bacterium]
MTTAGELYGERPGLVARARNILVRPQSEWRRVASEDHAPLIGSYVMPLVVLGGVVSFAASVLYGGAFALNASLISKALSAVLYVVLAPFGVMAAAFVVKWLAPRFGAEPNGENAERLATYSATPILVAMLAAVAPPVYGGVVAAGGIYALVLLALGVEPLMPLRDPGNNVPRFTILFAAIAALWVALFAMFVSPLINSGRDALTGVVAAVAPPPAPSDIPSRSAAELAIERLSQANARSILTDPARLVEQFPDSLPGGLQRQATSQAQRGGVSRADASYRDGATSLSLSILQFDSDVDPAAVAALLAVKADGAVEDGYDRTQSIDGRFYAEEVRATSSRYIVIGRGVVMIAQGGVTMDQARAAVETIGLQRLEAMFGR